MSMTLISSHVVVKQFDSCWHCYFNDVQVSGYCGLLLGSPVILYEIIAFVLPGLTRDERKFLGPIVLGSSVLFYLGIFFSYTVLAPAALNFFVNYADGAVESLWSIDQYFEFVLVLLFSTGLSFQVNTWSYKFSFLTQYQGWLLSYCPLFPHVVVIVANIVGKPVHGNHYFIDDWTGSEGTASPSAKIVVQISHNRII